MELLAGEQSDSSLCNLALVLLPNAPSPGGSPAGPAQALLWLQVLHSRLALARVKGLPVSSVSHSRQAKCLWCQASPSTCW